MISIKQQKIIHLKDNQCFREFSSYLAVISVAASSMLACRSVTENSCQKVARLWSLVRMARPLINHLIHL